jgi:allophanate hydrolase subunit 1
MSVFLFLSILTNVGLGWFVYRILNYQNELEEDLQRLSDEAQDLKLHIKSIYELDMFYGDDTLQSMLEHMNQFSEDVDYYIDKYSTEEDSEEEYQYDTDETETP